LLGNDEPLIGAHPNSMAQKRGKTYTNLALGFWVFIVHLTENCPATIER
jgi:hypothetical protein